MDKKYIFKKDYSIDNGAIKAGTEVVDFRGVLYINGYLCVPSYTSVIRRIIEDDALHKEYLKDEKFIKNEF